MTARMTARWLVGHLTGIWFYTFLNPVSGDGCAFWQSPIISSPARRITRPRCRLDLPAASGNPFSAFASAAARSWDRRAVLWNPPLQGMQ
jgi:hypothetical protein